MLIDKALTEYKQLYVHITNNRKRRMLMGASSSSARSLTRPVQQSSGPPSPHIVSGEAELLMATVRFALVGVCYISEEHARLSGPPHYRDTLGEGTII